MVADNWDLTDPYLSRIAVGERIQREVHSTLRREVLNAEWFTTTKQAQIVTNQWLRQYNHTRLIRHLTCVHRFRRRYLRNL